MARRDIAPKLDRIDSLVRDMKRFVPDSTHGATAFLADLAGLLVVAIAAEYENCVKEILVLHAARKHRDFEHFVTKNFAKISSKITEEDLIRYTKLFGDHIYTKFKLALQTKNDSFQRKTGQSIRSMYKQILLWRHDYAHAGIKNTTIVEAERFHMYAKRVVYCFDEAFS